MACPQSNFELPAARSESDEMRKCFASVSFFFGGLFLSDTIRTT